MHASFMWLSRRVSLPTPRTANDHCRGRGVRVAGGPHRSRGRGRGGAEARHRAARVRVGGPVRAGGRSARGRAAERPLDGAAERSALPAAGLSAVSGKTPREALTKTIEGLEGKDGTLGQLLSSHELAPGLKGS